jgi:phospholipid/cholesterol/gamma-HCH transport system substrate-binding protein
MKISNETKVGILTIGALTLLILGFNFLKGKELFTKSTKIYAVFKDLGPLSKSNEVKINGYVIGKVYDLQAIDKDITGIVATINLTEDVNIPENSQAYISSPLVGASFISIEKGGSGAYLKPGDTLNTRRDTGLFDDVKAQLNPTLDKVREGIDSLKIVFTNLNRILTSGAKNDLQQTLSNLNRASASLMNMLDAQTGSIARTVNNVNAVTDNLRKNNDSITATISNAKKFTERLSQLEVESMIDSMQLMISDFKKTMAKISSKDGTLGALINDKQLYNKLYDAVLAAEILVDDLRTNPKRYVNFSVFGKKDKNGPISSPQKKDSIPK